MAKKFGPDGVPVDVPSTPFRREKRSIFGDGPGPRGSGVGGSDPGRSARRPLFYDDEPTTRPMTRPTADSAPRVAPAKAEEPRTRIAGGPRPARDDEPLPPSRRRGIDDPVVGWLVVVEGPGQGCFVPLGNGLNKIGRGDESRVQLDFGDREISRTDHARVTYDPKGNKYYLQVGSGVNLVYLNGEPVLQPTILENGCSLSMGATTLRFVALCGDEFMWSEAERGPSA